MNRDAFFVKWAGNWSPRVVEVEQQGPSGLDGLRMLFVTDIHMGDGRNPERQMDRLFDQIASLDADLILWGGDYAEGDWHGDVMARIGKLRPRLGMFAVTGNNDQDEDALMHLPPAGLRLPWGLRPPVELRPPAGLRLLRNEVARVPIGDADLLIMGVDGVHESAADLGILLPARDGALRVLLAHSPLALDKMPEDRALWPELILCGHTHGGQINLFGLTPYSIGYERANRHRNFYLQGQHQIGHTQLIVSNGIGASKVPLRVGAPPEMHMVVFSNR